MPVRPADMIPRSLLVPLASSLVAFAGFASVASAQAVEYRLGDEGWSVDREPEAGTDEAFIAEMRRLIAEDRPSKARRELDKWIEFNEFRQNPWMAEALLARGDAWVGKGNEYKALFDYERLIREYPESDAFAQAVEREVVIARAYLGGMRRKLGVFRIEDAETVGEELLVRAQERLPGSVLAEKAAIDLADHYYAERDMPAASEAYEIFLTNYPRSDRAKHALKRWIFSNIARFRGPKYNAEPLLEAEILLDRFVRLYPGDAERESLDPGLRSRLDESAAAQMLETARWYASTGDETSARFTIRRLVRNHPATVAAQRGREVAEREGWELAPSRAGEQPVTGEGAGR
ncbi:MAG: outer membrane protein assembly factor BamD [Planctomycetota bacterium]